MEIFKQWYDSYGDIIFEEYFTTEEKAIKYRDGDCIEPDKDDDNWIIEIIEVN